MVCGPVSWGMTASGGPVSASDPPTAATALELVTPAPPKGRCCHGCPGLWDLGGGPFPQYPGTRWGGLRAGPEQDGVLHAAGMGGGGGPLGSMKNVTARMTSFICWGRALVPGGRRLGLGPQEEQPGVPRPVVLNSGDSLLWGLGKQPLGAALS